eukprot:14789.XXX_655923_656201_1 [CDS] Oithona nana genome sequencing.
MCTFIFVSLECPSLYFLTQSAYLSLHFPKGWYIFWLILMNLQTFASFSIICLGSPEETTNVGEYISIPDSS